LIDRCCGRAHEIFLDKRRDPPYSFWRIPPDISEVASILHQK
jgi:hypothetical protein